MSTAVANTDTPETKINPNEAARFLRAFNECSREMQEIVLEMSEIISSEKSTLDEQMLAFDAMMQALFPGTSTDVLEGYRELMKQPEAIAAASGLKAEEKHFSDKVRTLMAQKDITQEQLAKAAGIGQPAVSNILNRRCRPQRRTVERFAELLGVNPMELWPEIVNQEGS
jgi:lambda repressor-like predicted transcriptional regulator